LIKQLLFLLAFITVLILQPEPIYAQNNEVTKKIQIQKGEQIIDTLCILQSTFVIKVKNEILDSSLYHLDPILAILKFNYSEIKAKFHNTDSVEINYRTVQFSANKIYSHKNIEQNNPDAINPNIFSFRPSEIKSDFFYTEGLTKTGSISRGVNFGNNQDLSVNSTLNLELSGKISEDVNISASITDNNIPIQPDGNTQQLQDFDQVFIKVYDKNNSLTAGDFWMKRPAGYFMNYNKRAQGASYSRLVKPENKEKYQVGFNSGIAISKGKFARNVIQGVEGNQGPYRLRGAENELFIIVLAGTERVFIDGELLSRGQENDYIIDYNTSEITFTANHLITKDRRIVVEFQYSDKNYARSIFFGNTEWVNDKNKIFVNAYSEQDAKNQPLQQTLSTAQKDLLANIGDSLDLAVSNSIEEVEFSTNLVLYKLVDSLGYDSVFVFSVNPDSAQYRINFSFVGNNNGDYIQSEFTALGKTFKWIAPDTVGLNIIHRGNYAPVSLLSSPKQRQMITAGWEHSFNKKSKFGIETAYSKYDQNTFSKINDQDDAGFGGKIFFEQTNSIQKKENPLQLKSKAQLEMINSNFQQLERFRAVEFERNWNVLNTKLKGDQYIGEAIVELSQKKWGKTEYSFNTFLAGNDYKGFMHKTNSIINYKNFSANVNGSLLSTSGIYNTSFLRHKAFLSQKIGKIKVSFRDEHELNKYFNDTRDSIKTASYRFYDWETNLSSSDTSGNTWQLFYRERYDWREKNNSLSTYAVARQYGGGIEFLKNSKNQIRLKGSYRDLQIKDSSLTSQRPDQTILGRIEYDLKAWKGAVLANTFYEIGTGMELKKEFIYIEVPAGQGVYTWIDYNENNIKELNEFEIAAFSDQATYIRSFVPTSDYVRTYTNQFSQSLNLNPNQVWSKKKGILKFISKFSNQTAYRIDRKTNGTNRLDAYNPFLKEIADTSLLSLGTSLRNSFFFNRTSPTFGMDYTFQDSRNKVLLSNGFDSRTNIFHQVNLRWNMTRMILFQSKVDMGEKANASDFLSGRNYTITYFTASPKISYQPDAKSRISLKYEYSDKKNNPETGGEQAFISDIGAEIRYNTTEKGSILATFNFVQIKYNGNTNSSLAFEMLNSLKPGNNYTWTFTLQRTINKNMQLNLNYSGRKTENNGIIHTGGVQVRAFF
jgi:hypothetical protein